MVNECKVDQVLIKLNLFKIFSTEEFCWDLVVC